MVYYDRSGNLPRGRTQLSRHPAAPVEVDEPTASRILAGHQQNPRLTAEELAAILSDEGAVVTCAQARSVLGRSA